MMPLSATTERTRLNRFVRTGAKQTQNHITHAAETRNRVRAACWMTEKRNSGPNVVDRDARQRHMQEKALHLGNVG
jgi:hypothetical protein